MSALVIMTSLVRELGVGAIGRRVGRCALEGRARCRLLLQFWTLADARGVGATVDDL